MESLWDSERDLGIALHPARMRRNFVAEGVALPELIDQEFTMGGVRFKGLRACPPCLYLAQLLGIPEVLKGFARVGGIYASVLESGRVCEGDGVRV